MRILFIGHSFHQKTGSSRFFVELLQKLGTVDEVVDHSCDGGENPDLSHAHSYDLVVIWQMAGTAFLAAKLGLKNLVFVPMYDNAKTITDNEWKKLRSAKILCFSRFIYRKVRRLGCISAYFQYYPNPENWKEVGNFKSLRPYFWQRIYSFDWKKVLTMLGSAAVGKFRLQFAMDPFEAVKYRIDLSNEDALLPSAELRGKYNIEILRWASDRRPIDAAIDDSNLFFAPRLDEGIGMSFLEALVRGIPVVAANAPTMNEYIKHGVNGFLFNPKRISALNLRDLKKLQRMGRNARRMAQEGYKKWEDDEPRLLEFLGTPNEQMEESLHPRRVYLRTLGAKMRRVFSSSRRILLRQEFRILANPSLKSFGEPEEWGSWTDGALASIRLPRALNGDYRLVIKINSRFQETLKNGFYIRVGNVESRTLYSVKKKKITLTFKELREASDISIYFNEPKSPKELGLSNDKRQLGLGIKSIELRRFLLRRRRYAAVFTDSRPLPDIHTCADAHRKFLPRSWDCVIVTSSANSYVKDHGLKMIEISPDKMDSYAKMNWFRSCSELWEQLLDYDRVLIFERDTHLLRKGIQKFLKWDYVGAPWPAEDPWFRGHRVGNGGLSLRNPSLMLHICRNYKNEVVQEDFFFVLHVERCGGRIAPLEVAKKFSCESIFALGTLGCHAIEKYFTPAQVQKILDQYKK